MRTQHVLLFIQTGDSYVCSSTTGYKKLDYQALGRILFMNDASLILNVRPTIVRLKRFGGNVICPAPMSDKYLIFFVKIL